MSSQAALPAWLVPASGRQRTVWRAALACLVLHEVSLAVLEVDGSISCLKYDDVAPDLAPRRRLKFLEKLQ